MRSEGVKSFKYFPRFSKLKLTLLNTLYYFLSTLQSVVFVKAHHVSPKTSSQSCVFTEVFHIQNQDRTQMDMKRFEIIKVSKLLHGRN